MAPDSEQEFEEGGLSDFEEGDLSDFDLGDGIDGRIQQEESYEERFKAAKKEIKKKKEFRNEDDIDEFFRDFNDIASKSSSKAAGNLLHMLVEVVQHDDEVKSEHVELLVRRLVRDYPKLLNDSNKGGYNPLFVAVRASQHQLINYMVSTCVENKGQAIYMKCLNHAISLRAHDGKTCLHYAFKDKLNTDTIRMLIENASTEALAAQDDLDKTPMHYAVSFAQCTDARAEIIFLFIERDLRAIQGKPRPDKTFLDLADSTGFSVYQEHQNTRISSTRSMEKRRQAAEGGRQDQNDVPRFPDRPSPREALGGTRDSRHAVPARGADNRGPERPGRKDELDDREKERERRKAVEAAAKRERDATERDVSRIRPNRADNTDVNAAQTSNAAQQLEPAPNTPIKRSNTARFDSKPDQDRGREPAPERPAVPPRKTTNYDKAVAARTKNSDEILQRLKLHYMRTRNTEMVIFFLYGPNMDDIQVSFDYDRLPRKMFWNEFIKRFGADSTSGLKFDRVLQYALFPRVEVRLKGRLADLERDAELQSGKRQLGALGRKDMVHFCDWLYKKGVRHIIRLSVDDCGDVEEKVHSDEAIQESLERFIIERLDWKKTDLDPETILHISSKAIIKEAPTPENPKNVEFIPDQQLKQLYLKWSGSNAVLRAWSEPEGLTMLPRLQRIYLFKPPSAKMYDNPQWISKKVQEFQARLNANRKTFRDRELASPSSTSASDVGVEFGDVDVASSDSGTDEGRQVISRDTSHSTTSAPATGVNSHQWLDSTARFAGEMIPFWQNTVEEFLKTRDNRGTPERIEDDVVLALIDDGVDMLDTSLSGQVLEGKSFDFHDDKVRPAFSSARGHGTVMASMILQICPMVKIYPIRFKTYDIDNGKTSIDAGYAAQAIQAALDKKATMISMSWTVPMVKGKSESQDRLHAVLQKAVDSRVLMFCSAPDEGKFPKPDYPSGPWHDRFFRIGAACADGTVFNWTSEADITYVLPGVDVIKDRAGSSSVGAPSARDVTKRVVDFNYETGSVVATALAAGLAAMIIYCVKASIMTIKTANQNQDPVVGIAIPDNGANLIADPDAMKRAFASLGKVTPNKFIPVWEELDKISEVLETSRTRGSNPEVKMKRIERFVEFGIRLATSIKQ
ncbi:hypothetical protein F5B20DRAFT_526194 [Whalleya microplaca]|nr:hypothetical protein F5B20DRAFT_526194 [Whalleya microplaca]